MAKPVTRVTDIYTNPTMQGASAPIVSSGSSTLFVGNLPVIQMNNPINPIPDTSIPGATTVMHNNTPLNGMGDNTSQGGALLTGDFTVFIG